MLSSELTVDLGVSLGYLVGGQRVQLVVACKKLTCVAGRADEGRVPNARFAWRCH